MESAGRNTTKRHLLFRLVRLCGGRGLHPSHSMTCSFNSDPTFCRPNYLCDAIHSQSSELLLRAPSFCDLEVQENTFRPGCVNKIKILYISFLSLLLVRFFPCSKTRNRIRRAFEVGALQIFQSLRSVSSRIIPQFCLDAQK